MNQKLINEIESICKAYVNVKSNNIVIEVPEKPILEIVQIEDSYNVRVRAFNSDKEVVKRFKRYKHVFWENRKSNDLSYSEVIEIVSEYSNIFIKSSVKTLFLKDITLENFRKYEKLSISLDRKFTLLVGKNATGKTSILDAIAVACGAFLSGIDELRPSEQHTFNPNDIRFSRSEDSLELRYHISELQPMSVSGNFALNDHLWSWSKFQDKVSGKTRSIDNKNITYYVQELVMKSRNSDKAEDIMFPIFSYQGVGRLFQHTYITDNISKVSRFFGYRDCLNPNSSYKYFVAWFKKMIYEDLELRQIGKSSIEAKFVKDCIKEVFSSLDSRAVIEVLHLKDDIWLYFEDDKLESLSSMSSGFKNMFLIVSDIAFKMIILNRNCDFKHTPGIVLIDEIDMHLHPEWQKKIVKILVELFPNIQFIASSHSPFIIQSIEEGGFIKLDSGENILSTNYATVNKSSIEDISESIMDIEMPYWSARMKELFESGTDFMDTLNKIEQELKNDVINVDEAIERLKQMDTPYSEDISYSAFMESRKNYVLSEVLRVKYETY